MDLSMDFEEYFELDRKILICQTFVIDLFYSAQ